MARISPIDIQRNLSGLAYPASKREIIEQARAGGADEAIVRKLVKIRDRPYDGPDAIMKELNGDF
jgi:uncharacterized protein DUF2795